MTGESCLYCRFWQGFRREDVQGTCHRHAPAAATVSVPLLGIRAGETYWPMTRGSDRCGDFVLLEAQ